MFEIRFTPEAIDDLRRYVKRRRERVFYDIDERRATVKIVAIGHKYGNRLIVRGEEFQL